MGFLASALGATNKFKATTPEAKFKAQREQSGFQAKQADVQTSDYADAIRQSQQQALTGVGAAGAGAAAGLGGLATQYAARARGEGTSLAQEQLKQTTQQNASQAAGAMANVRGLNPAVAARNILQAQTAGASNAASAGAQLRAQEEATALAGQGSALQAQAGAEVAGRAAAGNLLGTAGGLETTQAGQAIQNLQQQQALQQKTEAENVQAGLTGQGLDLQTALANQQANLTAQGINAGVASQNAQTAGNIAGGVIGGAASAASMFSDERVKKEVVRHDDEVMPGVPRATFKYKGSDEPMEGVIAQDVEEVRPDLVGKTEEGIRYVHPMLAARPKSVAQELIELHAAGGVAGGGLGPLRDVNVPQYEAGNIGAGFLEAGKAIGKRKIKWGGDETPVPNSPFAPDIGNAATMSPHEGAQPLVTSLDPNAPDTRPFMLGGPYAQPTSPTPVPMAQTSPTSYAPPPLNRSSGGEVYDYRAGGKVPGKPKYDHDTVANDTVDAKLTPRERVTRLEVVDRPHVGEMLDAINDDPKVADALAREFVQHIRKQKGSSKATKSDPDDYGRMMAKKIASRRK